MKHAPWRTCWVGPLTRSLFTACAGLWALCALAAAGEPRAEMWLISTRRAPTGSHAVLCETQIDYRRLDAENHWVPGDEDLFLRGDDPGTPTTVFVHGNLVDPADAIHEGWSVYRTLQCQAAGRPFRLVIWSWPSQRTIRGIRDDVRLKACYCDAQAYYLAHCLDRIDAEVPLTLIGFSFGARVTTGALHLLGGGEIAGRSLEPSRQPKPKPIRAVLVAAALDAGWLLPEHRNGLALSQVDAMLVTVNPCDPVLKRYPLLYDCGRPAALGYTGPARRRQLGADGEKIDLLGVAGAVGRAHAWARYWQSTALRSRAAHYAFLDEPANVAGP